MSNQQKQPEDPPTQGAGPTDNQSGQDQNGITQGQQDHDAAALPTNDRHDTETATNKMGNGKT